MDNLEKDIGTDNDRVSYFGLNRYPGFPGEQLPKNEAIIFFIILWIKNLLNHFIFKGKREFYYILNRLCLP